MERLRHQIKHLNNAIEAKNKANEKLENNLTLAETELEQFTKNCASRQRELSNCVSKLQQVSAAKKWLVRAASVLLE